MVFFILSQIQDKLHNSNNKTHKYGKNLQILAIKSLKIMNKMNETSKKLVKKLISIRNYKMLLL